MKCVILGFALIVLIHKSYSVNILGLLPVSSPSHHIWNKSLMEAIAARGHNVTIISPDVEKTAQANIHYIHLEEVYPTLYNGSDKIDIIEMANKNAFAEIPLFHDFGLKICEGILKSKGLTQILNYPKDFKFDLVIHDLTCGACLLGVSEYFNSPPVIGISAFLNPLYKTQSVGGHNYPAYAPYYALPYDKYMNFFQRVHSVALYAADLFYRCNVFTPQLDKIMKKGYNNPNLPYVGDLDEKTVLLLINSHEAIEFPEPLAPNVIAVGGLQIKEPKPLPKNLEDFIQKGKNGAVLFSLGTNVRSDMLEIASQKMFIEAFRQIPQYNFLWKFESDLEITLPKNVMITSWLPQNDILAHPKVRAFITHGGGLSTQESIWHNVPMVGMPFIADQTRNIHKSVQTGVATKLDFRTLSTEKIKNAVLEVLQNPRYIENMRVRSNRFRDQKEKPLDRAVWWVEWVLRHPSPDHIISPVVKLGFIAGNCLDIYLFFIAVLLIIIYITMKLLSKITSSSKAKKSTTKLD